MIGFKMALDHERSTTEKRTDSWDKDFLQLTDQLDKMLLLKTTNNIKDLKEVFV